MSATNCGDGRNDGLLLAAVARLAFLMAALVDIMAAFSVQCPLRLFIGTIYKSGSQSWQR